jgi:branched-chain amino acid transport system ATP-binding protein
MTRSLLQLSAVNAFYGQAHILHEVTLDLHAGEVVALLGRNGAGKSTTIKTIMGLVRAASGKIHFDQTDITSLDPFQIARLGLGYVPEERRIFSELTVRENLMVGARPRRPDAPFWTENAVFDLFPKLAALHDRPGGQMSGGEQQMLTIARSLMGNPKLILLDEPSEGLAPVIVEMMAKAIQRLSQEGLTVLLSEQNLHFAALVAPRAIVLEKGEVRFDGPIRRLLDDPDMRSRYLAV